MNKQLLVAILHFLVAWPTAPSLYADETHFLDNTFVDVGSDRCVSPTLFRGSVSLDSGKPASFCIVTFAFRDGSSGDVLRQSVTANVDGVFRARIWYAQGKLRSTEILIESADGTQAAPSSVLNGSFGLTDHIRKEFKLCPVQMVRVTVVDANDSPVNGAQVALRLPFPAVMRTGISDASGLVSFRIPIEDDIEVVAALERDSGLDYLAFPLSRRDIGRNLTHERRASEPVELHLNLRGVRPIVVTATDLDGRALSGVRVRPSTFRKESEPSELNMFAFSHVDAATTDAAGQATISWFPAWQKGVTSLNLTKPGFETLSSRFEPEKDSDKQTVAMVRLVPIRGIVRHQDGRPASGITVEAFGDGFRMVARGKGKAVSGVDGTFEMIVPPDQIYLLVASGADDVGCRLANAAPVGVAVLRDTPVEGCDVTIRAATRVFGTLLSNETGEPLAGEEIVVVQYGKSIDQFPAFPIPNQEGRRKLVLPTTAFRTMTNRDGEFEFHLGDGKFQLRVPQWKEQDFTISGEAECELFRGTIN